MAVEFNWFLYVDSSEVAEMSQMLDEDQDGMDDVQLNGANPPLSM